MRYTFRKLSAGSVAEILPHELWLIPADRLRRDRRDLARLAMAEGPQGFLCGTETIDCLVVQADPTLDDMLAAAILERSLQQHPLAPGWARYAEYTALVREGLRPGGSPIESSLEGLYLAIRNLAGDDITDPEVCERFLSDWRKLAACINEAAEQGIDPFQTPIAVDRSEFLRHRTFLKDDHRVYRQDVARGERWIVHLPDGPPESSALILKQPRSLLWKYWARTDAAAPAGEGYQLIGILGAAGQWVFSTDPVQRFSLKGLASTLQSAETQVAGAQAGSDPWFDGQPFAHTLVAAPHGGTRLNDREVLQCARRWMSARPITATGRLSRRSVIVCSTVALAAPVAWWLKQTQDHDDGPRTLVTSSGAVLQGDAPPLAAGQSSMLVLSIGISRYRDDRFQLDYAAADAEALSTELQSRSGTFFKQVQTRQLVDETASKDDILRGLDWLRASATQHDLAVITVACHGKTDADGDFYVLPFDYDAARPLSSTAVSWYDFGKALQNMPCVVLVLLDACQSGAAVRTGLRAADPDPLEHAAERAQSAFAQVERGVVFMASSLAGQKSLENYQWGHGVLTLAVLEALSGQYLYAERQPAMGLPPYDSGEVVTFHDLNFYVSERVRLLTGGAQAVITKPSRDIDLHKIPLALREAGE